MKKRSLVILSLLMPTALTLSGCILKKIFNNDEETVVEDITIEVVSNLKINLSKRSSKQINPTLSNKGIKNPQFIYSSSNPSVATVDENGLVTGLSVGSSVVTISLKTNTEIKANVNITVEDKETAHYDYTIMLYMCGSDLEFQSNLTPMKDQSFITKDIKEILSVNDIPDTVNIIIETGGTKKWFMEPEYLVGAEEISAKELQRWEVLDGKLHHIATLDTNDMAKQSSFESFLNWGLDDYEADQMGVIISGHGGGIAGCAYDDNYKDSDGYDRTLRTFEVANACKSALLNSKKEKFTWIGYDCCVMQCADIASINADYFDYMVASQQNENASGWNHDYYLPYLKSNPTIEPTEFLPKICDGFLLENHSNYEALDTNCYQTLSVLDLSKADEFTDAFNYLVASIGSGYTAFNVCQTAFKNSFTSFGDGVYGLCDFATLLKQLKAYDITGVSAALNELVFYKKNCPRYVTVPCGLNAFFPLSMDKLTILQVGRNDYSDENATKLTSWQTLCLDYGKFGW